MSARPQIGKVAMGFGVVTGLAACALGVGLVLQAESAFGKAWAAMFVVLGLVALLGAVTAARPIDESSPGARSVTLVSLLLIAGWAVVVGVIGAVQENWLWPVLMGVPAAYLVWAVVRVLRAAPDR